MLVLPAIVQAQTPDVPVTVNGITVPQIAVPAVYNGKYVLQLSTWGFFWLDTDTMQAGHVQAISLCVANYPPSESGFYLGGGDCNSFSQLVTSGNIVVPYTNNGLCWAKIRGCGGPRDDGHMLVSFGLGNGFPYLGDLDSIPPRSTQMADPQGRTWTVLLADTTYRNFYFHVLSGGGATATPSATPTPAPPTPTPTPGPATSATNLSGQARGDGASYYGDQWQFQDISNPSSTRTDWDFNYLGSFVSNEGGGLATEGTVTGYFPCDPSSQGVIRTGAGCRQSLGLQDPPASGNYQFAMLSNVSPNPLVSSAVPVSCPQALIVGYAGFSGTCAKAGGVLTVARGGTADARGSKGNITDAQTSFDWTFPGSQTPNVSGSAVGVPGDATTFTLTITFPGGYHATASGSVTLVDSVPRLGIYTDADLTQPPFVQNGAFQLTAGTPYYLKDIEDVPPASAHFFLHNAGGDVELPGSPTAGPGPLQWTPGSPCSSGCSVKVTVGTLSDSKPVVISPSGGPTPAPTPVPTATPPPSGGSVTVFVTGPTSGTRNTALAFTANASGGSGNYGYSWACDYNPFSPLFSSGTQTRTCTYSVAGTYNVKARVVDNSSGSTAQSADYLVTITGGLPAPSSNFTPSGPTVVFNQFNGRYEASAGSLITFTAAEDPANVTSYTWSFGDGASGSGKSVTHTYASARSYTASLTVAGNETTTSGTASASKSMTITGPSFRSVIVPGVAHLDDGTTTWRTDVSIANAGASAINIAGAFVPFMQDGAAAPSLDLTQLNYTSPIPLSPGASLSVSDVVAALEGGNNKGTLVIKYTGSVQAPLVSARVYFQPKVNPGNISYGSGIPAYEVDGTGKISPQGFVSIALSKSPSGVQSESEETALDVGLSVNLTGSGSGTVTSSPAGINCPATCTFSFPVGTSVQLSGTAAAGSTFFGITGCDAYPVGQCVMTMNSSKSVTARFNSSGPTPTPTPGPTSATLTLTKGGTGSGTVLSAPSGINCGATCSAAFPQGTSVALTASSDSGSTFAGWGGACSGTGSCAVTLSADTSVSATFTASAPPPSTPQAEQYLIGVRSDPRYRFVVTLFNASGSAGDFQVEAFDDLGSNVNIFDDKGTRVKFRKFTNLRPYQQVYLRDSDLGLGDGKSYVLKATRTSTDGTLLAFGTALDRKTNDLVQISDDSQVSQADESGSVSYWVAGVSRYDSTYGAHWRTDLRIFNRSLKRRNLDFEYSYTPDGVNEHVAHVYNVPIGPSSLLTYDDVVSALLATDTSVDLSGNSAGILRISYPEDEESATSPLVIGSRNYDDEPTGTAGSQLAVYTSAQAGAASHNLFLTGVEDSDRYASRIGVFAMDPGPVTGMMVVVAPDGSEVGSVGFTLGGSNPHFAQISLTDSNMHFTNPGQPVSIRFEQLSGGRVGAYAFTVDKVTLDTNFIQALPQN